MQQVFFIGLGNMGMPMALNLIKNGYHVTGYDLNQEILKKFKAQGGAVAATLKEAKKTDICITMLQTGDQVRQTCIQDGIFSLLTPGSLYIDCSTIDVNTSRQITQAAIAANIAAIDAPVSGGVKAAQLGGLTFMVGGEFEYFKRAKPVLMAMGQQIIHAGSSGCGQVAKMCNNMILGVTMTAVSEAFNLATVMGLDAKTFHAIVTKASGKSWVTENYMPVPAVMKDVPANNDYTPGFTAAMMLKDLCLSQEAARLRSVNTPMGSLACKLYEKLTKDGFGQKDFSVIIKYMENIDE